MAFSEDRSVFFDSDQGFAEDVTIGSTAVKGIFENAYIEDNGVAGVAPTLLCDTDTLPTLAWGTTTATVRSVSYLVVRAEADGTGLTRLILRRAT